MLASNPVHSLGMSGEHWATTQGFHRLLIIAPASIAYCVMEGQSKHEDLQVEP